MYDSPGQIWTPEVAELWPVSQISPNFFLPPKLAKSSIPTDSSLHLPHITAIQDKFLRHHSEPLLHFTFQKN